MKALLIARDELPPRAHDLVVLADLIGRYFLDWSWPADELRFLSRAAVTFRYPGESAERQDAEEAVAIAGRLRESLLSQLQPE